MSEDEPNEDRKPPQLINIGKALLSVVLAFVGLAGLALAVCGLSLSFYGINGGPGLWGVLIGAAVVCGAVVGIQRLSK